MNLFENMKTLDAGTMSAGSLSKTVCGCRSLEETGDAGLVRLKREAGELSVCGSDFSVHNCNFGNRSRSL